MEDTIDYTKKRKAHVTTQRNTTRELDIQTFVKRAWTMDYGFGKKLMTDLSELGVELLLMILMTIQCFLWAYWKLNFQLKCRSKANKCEKNEVIA